MCKRVILSISACCLLCLLSCSTMRKGESASLGAATAPARGGYTLPSMPSCLSGRILDEAGQPVPGAEVVVTSRVLAGPRGAVTNLDGVYILPNLPAAADYKVQVDASGYNKIVQKGIEVSLAKPTHLNLALSAGSTCVNVVASAPVIDMRSTSSSMKWNADEISAIPLDRNASNIAFLAPSAVSSAFSSSPSVGGASGPQNAYIVNGLNTTDPVAGTFAGNLSAEQLVVIETRDTPGEIAKDPATTQGTLKALDGRGERLADFPLKHTDVVADISGYLSQTQVRQVYTNPYKEVIEAAYAFPLPTTAAVNGFVMEVAGRRIVGIVRPREEAQRIYQEARAAGMTASLLTQERPNLFTQNVANIEPGGEVAVQITYFERLSYRDGTYEYVFPMVVGPRYIPGGATPPAAEDARPEAVPAGGGGLSAPTDQVPDADRITPPALMPGFRSSHDISLTVNLDAGLPVQDVQALAHRVDVVELGPTQRVVSLSPEDSIPNKDFVLRWTVAAAETQFGVLSHSGPEGSYFTLMLQPPLSPSDAQVTPREITFVLDTSGSMSGLPIETSKALVTRALDGLRPYDVFNIFFYSGGSGQLWDAPQPNTPENVREAKRFVGGMAGNGGTEMLSGVMRALRAQHEPQFLQMFVFLTDGYVGNETQILELARRERGDARFFAFGIGSSVNRYLIEGIGKAGGGGSHVVMPQNPDHMKEAVGTFFKLIDSPVLVDITVDWNSLPVEQTFPDRIGDLFAGDALALVGRFQGPATGTAFVRGRVGGRQVEYPVQVDFPAFDPAHAALAPVWARTRIEELSDAMLTADAAGKEGLQKQITDLAVKHTLVSAFTSFVAVDESRTVGDGRPLRVLQPLEMPEGVSYEGIFGEQPSALPVNIASWGASLALTAKGNIRVGKVEEGGEIARAGIAPKARLVAVNGTKVNDLDHLEGLLLQSHGPEMTVRFEPGGEVTLKAP